MCEMSCDFFYLFSPLDNPIASSRGRMNSHDLCKRRIFGACATCEMPSLPQSLRIIQVTMSIGIVISCSLWLLVRECSVLYYLLRTKRL